MSGGLGVCGRGRNVVEGELVTDELLYAQPEPEFPENPELSAGVVEAERTA